MVNGQTIEARKQRVLEAWVNNPLKTYVEIAELAGVSEITFRRYRADEKFMEDYHQLCKQRFQSMEALAVQKLEEKLVIGDWQAVKYLLDGTGYKPTDKQEIKVDDGLTIKIEVDED